MALNRVAETPLATSNSPLSLDFRVSWFSIEELNILWVRREGRRGKRKEEGR